ncbi:MAG: 2-succinyl-5-enolpyruvyl-6-hydroxy-3-cyclohexene-1-carboxylic-acid synthase [Deltaproteobacteria bacterium]|nr:MAG: 2-succinyl-5-enolpyruvyl-6-hydroxy-3-cyclohexene-1-carboxylic-acid synthase [Deltaproteobacteria bacterium]
MGGNRAEGPGAPLRAGGDGLKEPDNLNALFARALVDELCAAGAREAVISPGSRSTPLVLACAEEKRMKLRVVLDERSAAFVALGAAKATGRPALALATSGTAGAHFFPAILEAEAARVPLVALTADRPLELHGFGAPQTMDQQHLFGTHVRFFADLGAPEPLEARLRHLRAVAALACSRALGPPRGPVHLNVPYREPLSGADAALPALRDRPAPRIATPRLSADDAALDEAAREISARPRGVIVCGPRDADDDLPDAVRALSRSTGYPILAEAASQVRFRVPEAVAHYDAILKHRPSAEALRPEAVIRFGAGLTSKTLQQWLDASGAYTVLVSDDSALFDPAHAASLVLAGDAVATAFALADRVVRPAGASLPFADADLAALPAGSQLFVSSSMPVRDVDAWAGRAAAVRVLANRGVNGIDGIVASALGAALATSRRTAVLLGDLALLHDLGGLVAAARLGAELTLVVVDNDGGGIFSFLPIASQTPRFEELFGTPHGLDLARAAALAGARLHSPRTLPELRAALRETGGLHFVHVRSDRARNVERHRALEAAVASALGSAP